MQRTSPATAASAGGRDRHGFARAVVWSPARGGGRGPQPWGGWPRRAAGVGPPRDAGWARGGRGAGGRGRGRGRARGRSRGQRQQCPEPGSGAGVAAAEPGCLQGAPGHRRVNGPPGPAQSRYRPRRDPRSWPPSLPGPVRAPAARARAVPAPRVPRSCPSRDPGLCSLGRSSSSWGRIPGEGVSDPVELWPHHPGGESAKIPTKSRSKVGKHTQDLPARAGASFEDVCPCHPRKSRSWGQGRWEGCAGVPLIWQSLMTGREGHLFGSSSKTHEWRVQ